MNPHSSAFSAERRTIQAESALPFSWWQPLGLVLLYSLTFLFMISALGTDYGFPLDDSYIHQTVARNLATYGIPGFIPGVRSSGATSLIWTYLQAANYRFLHVDPVVYNLAFSWLMFALIGPLLLALARRDGLSSRTCWILAATPALCGNFLWLGLIGMEHLLFVAISLTAIYFWFYRSPQSGATNWPTALAAALSVGLLAITRPEGMVFGPLLLAGSYLVDRYRKQTVPSGQRSLKEHGLVLGVWAAFLALALAANLYTSRALMPATMKGRTWLYFRGSGGPHSAHSIVRFMGSWIEKLPRMFSAQYVQPMGTLSEMLGIFAVLGFLLLGLAVLGMLVLLANRPLRVGFLFCWAFVQFGIYLGTFPTAGHGGRYQPLNLLLIFPCFCFGILWLLGRLAAISSTSANWPAAATAVVMLIAGTASLRTWREVTIDGVELINGTHGKIALWLKDHVPPDASIAAFDIGRISYDWGRGITDLGGLVDPLYYPYLENGRVPEYLEMKHIQYLVLPSEGTEGFGFQHTSLGMTKLVEYCSPKGPWLVGWRYTINAMQCQELYRLNYPNSSAEASRFNAALPTLLASSASSVWNAHTSK